MTTEIDMNASTSTSPPCSSFNIEDMRPRGLVSTIIKWLLDEPQCQWWMGLLRRFCPIFRVPFKRWAIVTRFEHVQEVLDQEQVFQVPFDLRMRELMPGPLFVLAMQDGLEYRRQRQQIMQAFRLEDVAATIAPRSAELAEQILAGCSGRIDAIEDLLTRVPTLLCRDYYGVDVRDPKLFAQWLIAISAYLFGRPSDKRPKNADTALAAANCVGPLIDQSIRSAKHAQGPSISIVARLVEMQKRGAGDPSDALIRAELFGMLTGFVPTNMLASGNVLEMLLRRPDFMESAQAAARADDDELLRRCLFEIMRFRPINPGPFRKCVKDYTIADGSFRAKRIPADTKLLVSTQSAMFDERSVVEPKKFLPNRPGYEYMLFGYGLHWCIGAYIAGAQITQTFKPLLKKRGLRRAPGRDGQMQTVGPMPGHLSVEFDP
jgi:cytochrome P450